MPAQPALPNFQPLTITPFRVQNNALQIITGCTRISPTNYLHYETKILPIRDHINNPHTLYTTHLNSIPITRLIDIQNTRKEIHKQFTTTCSKLSTRYPSPSAQTDRPGLNNNNTQYFDKC